MIRITSLDHLVLTVTDIDQSIEFYTEVLGMKLVHFGDNRVALHFGQQKINLHETNNAPQPRAAHPAPGTADLCLLTDTPVEQLVSHLQLHNTAIEEGPVERTGATGKLLSVYIRDPDRNLIEIANPA